jgi:hypothetical protein
MTRAIHRLTGARAPTLAALAVLASSVALAPRAWAAPARDPASAEALFEQGRTAAARRDWQHACSAFEQSQGLDPAVGTLLNLGECRYRLGKLASAWQDFVEALRELPDGDDRRPYAQQRAAELDKRAPRLVVAVPANLPSGTTVLKDGVEMPAALLGMTVPVDPGTVTLVVRAPGHAPIRFDVTLSEGQVRRIEVHPGEVLPPAAAGEHPSGASTALAPGGGATDSGDAASSTATWRTAGFVTTGVGAAALAAGAVTGILALSRAASYRNACGPSYACSDDASLQSARSAASDAKTFSTISTVTLIAGGVAAAAGLTIYFTHRPSSQAGAAHGADGVSGVGVSAAPGGALGVWRVTF